MNAVQKREFINGIGKTGEPISSTVIKDLKKAVSPYTTSWRGQGHSHTGGARARQAGSHLQKKPPVASSETVRVLDQVYVENWRYFNALPINLGAIA